MSGHHRPLRSRRLSIWPGFASLLLTGTRSAHQSHPRDRQRPRQQVRRAPPWSHPLPRGRGLARRAVCWKSSGASGPGLHAQGWEGDRGAQAHSAGRRTEPPGEGQRDCQGTLRPQPRNQGQSAKASETEGWWWKLTPFLNLFSSFIEVWLTNILHI